MNSQEVENAYYGAVNYLKPYMTYDACKKISILDKSMDPDRPFDFVLYLERSLIRYKKIFNSELKLNTKWLEVGALFPALPITLSMLGFRVTVVEEFGFYPREIRDLYDEISQRYSVVFLNKNVTSTPKVGLGGDYEYVSLMGVIEHLPHTPRLLLENIHSNMKQGGTLFVDVPNLYFAATIIRFLKGKHIQPPIETIYDSGIPYVGHHREYSIPDLRYVLGKSGFGIKRLELFNYSFDYSRRDIHKLWALPMAIAQFRPLRETIFTECIRL